MGGHTLLTRIQHPEFATTRREPTEAEIRDSVLRHLRTMVTTRQGTVITCPDFGICEVTELLHAFPEAIAMLARSIRTCIQNHEPRLTNVSVKHIPGDNTDLTLRFEVTAQIVREGGKSPVKFETELEPSRRIRIR
jgi:type VI secretion system protein